MNHPLDRPAWHALTSHQAPLALGDARAWRFAADVSPFAAAPDDAPESVAALAALLSPAAVLALVQVANPSLPDGLVLVQDSICLQMMCTGGGEAPAPVAMTPLGDGDAEEMRALAELTQPGPFLARTHTLGRFCGVREGGRLVAMAGERLHPTGFTEVSAVCTHPDWRGRGLAAALMGRVIENIRAREETPFLHVYATNRSAIAMYERLGFTGRREVQFSVWARP